MEFCSKCGGLVVPEKGKGETKLKCQACGHEKRGKYQIKEKAKGVKWVEAVDKTVGDTQPKVKIECKSCGNDEAYFRTEQTRAADEPETQFFTCTKCSKGWREYE